MNADTIKTSAGAAFRVPICREKHIKYAIYLLQAYGIATYGANEKADDLIYDIDFTQDCAIVMGSEDRGISAGVLKLLNGQYKLPMKGEIESLNVSVAAGISLYEVLRQRL
jgi:23S rRNA (guanosine2251-2'-O)-methyltransferase